MTNHFPAAEAEVERLRERLQIDPGGSDKIDELSDVVMYLRAEVAALKASANQEQSRRQVAKGSE